MPPHATTYSLGAHWSWQEAPLPGPQLEHSIGPFDVQPQPAPDGKLQETKARAAVQPPGPESSRLADQLHWIDVSELALVSSSDLLAPSVPLQAIPSALIRKMAGARTSVSAASGGPWSTTQQTRAEHADSGATLCRPRLSRHGLPLASDPPGGEPDPALVTHDPRCATMRIMAATRSLVSLFGLGVLLSASSACGGKTGGPAAGDNGMGIDASTEGGGSPPGTMGSTSSSGTGSGSGAPSGSSGGSSSSSGSSGGEADSGSGSSSGSGVDSGSEAEASCGAAGQSCCGTSCNAGNACVAIGGASQCEACGQPGQLCCTTMPACQDAADSCFFRDALQYCMSGSPGTLGQPGDGCTTTCADPADTCVSNGMSSYCIVCGGLGNPCCGTTCGTSLHCAAGTCQ
jgi:hypothetical protein